MSGAVTTRLYLVVPHDLDDLTSPSGGDVYDRRVCQGLSAAGWQVDVLTTPGSWPRPTQASRAELAVTLAAIPDDAVVILDGLVACAVPDVVVPETGRLRLVVLVHLPLADETGLDPEEAAALDAAERDTVRSATAVVATSEATARRVIEHHAIAPGKVHVVVPGVDAAPLARGTDGASQLLCVAALTPRKGQDVLVEALASITDLSWSCDCVGARGRASGYVERVLRMTESYDLDERVRFLGSRVGDDLDSTYTVADLLILPSHAEPYGMVVTEALSRGIPVLATDVDGVPEALGQAPDGSRPGILVPPGDPESLSRALRRWLREPATREQLRAAARDRRGTLPGWEVTSQAMGDVVRGLRTDAGRAS